MKNCPPVRIVESDQTQNFALSLSKELSRITTDIMDGREVFLSPFLAYAMPISTYAETFKKKSILLTVNVEKFIPESNIYLFFEFTTAIAMANIMRMQPDKVILERTSKEIYGDNERDSFGEVGNQFVGALDRSLRELTPANVHLKLDFKQKIFPEEGIESDQYRKFDEYIVWTTNLEIEGFPNQKLNILIQQELFEKFLTEKVQLTNISPDKIILYSLDLILSSYIADQVNSRYYHIQQINDLGDCVHHVKSNKASALCVDFGDVPLPLPIDITNFAKRLKAIKHFEEIPVWVKVNNITAEHIQLLRELGLRGFAQKNEKEDLHEWLQMNVLKFDE